MKEEGKILKLINKAPFDNAQKLWLKIFCSEALGMKFNNYCDCKDKPLLNSTFQCMHEVNSGISRCILCRRIIQREE